MLLKTKNVYYPLEIDRNVVRYIYYHLNYKKI
jgi:hypothetical protein